VMAGLFVRWMLRMEEAMWLTTAQSWLR
jgi:hypothetical protein